jgi:hypothetical protein
VQKQVEQVNHINWDVKVNSQFEFEQNMREMELALKQAGIHVEDVNRLRDQSIRDAEQKWKLEKDKWVKLREAEQKRREEERKKREKQREEQHDRDKAKKGPETFRSQQEDGCDEWRWSQKDRK